MRNLVSGALPILLVGAWSLTATADEDKGRMERLLAERKASIAKLRTAFASNDKAALVAMFAPEVKLRGVWFASESCLSRFGGRVTVKQPDHEALAGCLVELGLKPQGETGLAHEPGVSIQVYLLEGKLHEMTSFEVDPTSPTIDADVLEKHAKRKLDVKRDKKTAAAMKKDPELVVNVDMRLCIDTRGKVDALTTESEITAESYRIAVEAAAKKWTFKPFKRGGKPIRVCASHYLTQYDGQGVLGGIVGGAAGDDPPPPPPPTPIKT